MVVDYRKKIASEEMQELPGYVYEGEVVVIDDSRQINEAVERLSGCDVLGFDTETKPSFQKGEFHPVSLLQLASEDCVYLFRLNKCGFTLSLRQLMANDRIVKVGVGIRDDIRLLRRLGEFKPGAFVDLQDMATNVGIEDKSFSKLMAIIFGVKISKRQQVSNWEATVLTQPQVRYAATDAWGAREMYNVLTDSLH